MKVSGLHKGRASGAGDSAANSSQTANVENQQLTRAQHPETGTVANVKRSADKSEQEKKSKCLIVTLRPIRARVCVCTVRTRRR